MTTTYRHIHEFANAANAKLNDSKAPAPAKFAYALGKMLRRAQALIAKYQEQIEDINVEHCIEKDGKLTRDERGGYEYSRAGMQARNKAVRTLTESSVEIESFLVKDVPEDLSPSDRLSFEGFVIAESESQLKLVETGT